MPNRFMSLDNHSTKNAKPELKNRVLNIRSKSNSKEQPDDEPKMDQTIYTPLNNNPAFSGTVRVPSKFGAKKNTQIFTNTQYIQKIKRDDFEARSMHKKTPFTPFTPNYPMESQQPLFELRSG
jgi:hypothetical protein